VVPNAIIDGGSFVHWEDNINWVGGSYTLFENYGTVVVDSAQEVNPGRYVDPNTIVIYSFYPTKPVGGMDGGIVASNNKEVIEWFRLAVHNGVSQEGESWNRRLIFPGNKMHMNSAQAYVIIENLKKYPNKREKLYDIRQMYNKALQKQNGSYHLYRINVNNREEFMGNMKKAGIACGIHYQAAHREIAYHCEQFIDLPLSDAESKTTISIPFHEKLTKEDMEHIVRCIKEYRK
jgi:dTDP-4-amino-4,6-dideoxygalactose transaminase